MNSDLISRQAAIDAIRKLHSIETEYDCTLYEKLDVLYELEDLPPVTPVKKQEPCEDAISREAVIDIIEDVCPIYGNDYRYILRDKINELPPVTAEKVGHWIDHQEDRWIYAKCSECETVHDSRTNYCPHCGAKMGGEQNE